MLLLWSCLPLLLRGCLMLLLRCLPLWFRLPLLRNCLSLLLLWSRLALRLRSCLPLLLLLRCRLMLLRCLPLLLLRSLPLKFRLPLLLRSHLALLLRSLPLLRSRLTAIRLILACLTTVRLNLVRLVAIRLILIRLAAARCGALSRLRGIRTRLCPVALLRLRLIARLHCRGSPHIAIGRKRLLDGQTGRATVVDVGKLRPVGAGRVFILDLRPHGRGMSLMASRQLRWSGAHLQPALSAVVAHTHAAASIPAHRTVIHVAHNRHIHIIVGAVVVEVSAAPVAALVADAHIAKAVIHAAIVADVRTPIPAVKPIVVIVIAPVAGGPQRALVGSLHPTAGNPVITALAPGPVAGSPKIIVAGSLRLVVVGQGRRRLIGVFHWLCAIPWIV